MSAVDLSVREGLGRLMRWLFDAAGLSRDARRWGSFPQAFAKKLGVEVQRSGPAPGFGTPMTRTSPSAIAEITNDIRDRANVQGDDWSLVGDSVDGIGLTYGLLRA